ncbi:hypothetical protein WCP94_000314 (plasmid) [Bilophila wadsworthia]
MWEKGPSLPPPPILPPKTFELIESLLSFFPDDRDEEKQTRGMNQANATHKKHQSK